MPNDLNLPAIVAGTIIGLALGATVIIVAPMLMRWIANARANRRPTVPFSHVVDQLNTIRQTVENHARLLDKQAELFARVATLLEGMQQLAHRDKQDLIEAMQTQNTEIAGLRTLPGEVARLQATMDRIAEQTGEDTAAARTNLAVLAAIDRLEASMERIESMMETPAEPEDEITVGTVK